MSLPGLTRPALTEGPRPAGAIIFVIGLGGLAETLQVLETLLQPVPTHHPLALEAAASLAATDSSNLTRYTAESRG